MRSWTASAALFASITTAPTVAAYLTKVGNVTLFSDTSCSEPVFVNSWGLGRDFCAKVDSSASSPLDVAFQSYILNERPWCDNGSRPYLNVYRDEACAELIRSYEPGALYNPTGPDADGSCIAPGGSYKAMAFICDGFDGAWENAGGSTPTGSSGEASAKTSSVESPVSSIQGTTSASSETDMSSASPPPSTALETTSATTAIATPTTSDRTTDNPSTATSTPTSAFNSAGSSSKTHDLIVAWMVPLVLVLLP